MRGLILLSVLLAAPLTARDLPVPPNKGWQHAETGLILPATLDGLARTKLVDATTDEHDVTASFDSADGAVEATVYIFHPAIDNVAMWFERSQAQIEARKTYGGVAPMSADPMPFAAPGGTPGSALRRSYTPEHGPVRATALAVMPIGEWLVAVRLSSEKDLSVALDRRLDAVIAAMRWPMPKAPAPLVTPIAACADALHFENAKKTVAKGADTLMTLLMSTALSNPSIKKTDERPVVWCRDAATQTAFGIYRDASGGQGYEIALNDAGRVIHVTPTLDTMVGKAHSYAVSLTGVDGTTAAYPSFDRLPNPEQVIASLDGGTAGSVQPGKNGNINITLPPSAK